MRRWWTFWVTLFDDREEGTSLALFRITLGCVVLYSLLSIVAAGLLPAIWTSVEYGGMRKLGGNWFVQYLGGPKPEVMWTLWGAALASALAFVFGVFGRWGHRCVVLVLLQSYNGLATMNGLGGGSYDALITNALWILFFAETSSTLSVHARRRTGQWLSSAKVSAWPRYVLIFQLLLMYSLTGIQKASHIWTPSGGYTALYWVLQDWGWTRFDLTVLAAWASPLLRVATAITWHWEQLSLGLLIWFYYRRTSDRDGRVRRWVLRRDWRIGWALIGLMLHGGILLLMNVGPFSWVTMSFYVLLWTPAEWARGFERVREWRRARAER